MSPRVTCELYDRVPQADAAVQGGLRYVSDCLPGMSRRRSGSGFSYHGPDGSVVRDPGTLARIRALAIPPAWTGVWICEDPLGHLQATGRDARGRKQYRYHPRWRQVRDATKFERLSDFGEALASIRRSTRATLRRDTLDRDRVLALVVRLLDETLVRIGNREYELANDSFGLTTLKDQHVELAPGRVRLRFRGKAGKEHVLGLDDAKVARMLRRLRDLPGEELFQYLDDKGVQHIVGSGDVNDYLRRLAGREVTSKDFRTWGGTLAVAERLASVEPGSKREAERTVIAAVEDASAILGNTPAVCRKGYVHPVVIEAFLQGRLPAVWRAAEEADDGTPAGLRRSERLLLRTLRSLSG